jgi:hypothetical protein
MPDTVPVTFDLDPETAAALVDPATRARVERLIQRTVKPASTERLFEEWMPSPSKPSVAV